MADTPHSASLTEGPRFGLTRPKPVGAPHVVAIVLDDTGFGQLGCFGSTIETPAIDRLASEGLRFTRFHVTAMCSPTRASFFTGRNAHRVGMGFVADIPLDHPGYTARIPESAATLARHFRDAGWATRALGKWHLVPRYERSDAGPFNNWPLGLGFERYYGFLLGDTNQWRPHLVEDNHYLDPPASWPENYHLSEDLVDRTLSDISSVRVSAPGKPTFTYVAFGAAHAPHHVPKRWIDHYAGKFDQGWDAWRDEVIEKQRQLGIIPDDTHASLRPPWVEAWDSLSDDEKKMHARQQEVFAAFLSHTDEQIGRLLDGLDDQGLSDNTIVMLFSDNGASAEGGRLGSVNEHRFTAHIPEFNCVRPVLDAHYAVEHRVWPPSNIADRNDVVCPNNAQRLITEHAIFKVETIPFKPARLGRNADRKDDDVYLYRGSVSEFDPLNLAIAGDAGNRTAKA